ncbi:MAG: DEAD/DEAH box helicase [Holophagales bacterium]|nr:DEAD/DEAH box helicase [Holophagales bacterium]
MRSGSGTNTEGPRQEGRESPLRNGLEAGSSGAHRGREAWAGPESPLADFVRRETKSTLASYGDQPNLVKEHANQEHDTAHGGYADRQVIELAQNSADALLQAESGFRRISIRLSGGCLYCADDGLPVDESGITALMFAHLSSKRNTASIGRFGLGFKSVLGVTDAPEFYSRSVSFRFGRERARRLIKEATGREFRDYPVLRLPESLDPSRAKDETLGELMTWATNIVRLPLLEPSVDALRRQIRDFPAEFLLLVPHVRELHLADGQSVRLCTLRRRADEEFELSQADVSQQTEQVSRWRLFQTMHTLSQTARDDRRSLDDGNEVPVTWAAPLDGGRSVGYFWAYFPTRTASLVGGILNAPWKTNEDRQNLLPGPYNDDLIRAAAALVAENLRELSVKDDPSAHLDALPRGYRADDSEHANLLRKELFRLLPGQAIVPDQSGDLREIHEVRYPPSELTPGTGTHDPAPFERWASYPHRPDNWLHHSALNRVRLATIERLFPERPWPNRGPRAPRASLEEWLEALVKDSSAELAVAGSIAAVRTAIAIPEAIRQGEDLGAIVLTEDHGWKPVDADSVFLPTDAPAVDGEEASTVHRGLANDQATRKILLALGLRTPSPEATFREAATRALPGRRQGEPNDLAWTRFWATARGLSTGKALDVLREFVPQHLSHHDRAWLRKQVLATTMAESWRPLRAVLLPGSIVPTDGSRDDGATIDIGFHNADRELLRELGATDGPTGGLDLRCTECFDVHRRQCEQEYKQEPGLPHHPQSGYLQFGAWQSAGFEAATDGAGPLDVLAHLSPEAAVRFTSEMLKLEATFEDWPMGHFGSNGRSYPSVLFESPAVSVLREHGRVGISGGSVPLSDALGSNPKSLEAQNALWHHSNVDLIRHAFDLHDPKPEFIGEAEPVPLTDVWPGLGQLLPQTEGHLIRCERILVAGHEVDCRANRSTVYLAASVADEEEQLWLISRELELDLSEDTLQQILHRRTPKEVQARRDEIRREPSAAERLLAAVGDQALRDKLPKMLLAMLEVDGAEVSGKRLAEAAIATWHTDTLRQHREALHHLDPPKQWAGSSRALAFVQALGFADAWAGQRAPKRDPWLEVTGPQNLPPLHDYQERVSRQFRTLLRRESSAGGDRRAMISLPTGSGKTRVAVQAIVEAVREDDFPGGVLWVADRDELCEQAVEAWREVWASVGESGQRLRISRAWAGQESPRPLRERHVVVASIQTLQARRGHPNYRFLAGLQLVVFDEAHRSIAPTYTSVMEEIGLTRYQRSDEPFLVGLTATPYRGRDADETARLANRYGQRRLDDGAFPDDEPTAVVQHLQTMGVLSQADHEVIPGDTFRLLDDDMRQDERWTGGRWNLPWLPQRLENRIAASTARTKRILDAFEKHIEPDWPVLVFATSVEHAQTLAALLEDRGIRSRAISGSTRTAARRHAVDEFRKGGIRALVNYGVFREGFDAPKTRAILVARPVYSPNLYFQMIGRGLRGPRNGGTERCLILNVEDNIENFGRKLAFADLDGLWSAR